MILTTEAQKVWDWATKNYSKGGDTIIECMEEDELNEAVAEAGSAKKFIAIEKRCIGVRRERQADADYYSAQGTEDGLPYQSRYTPLTQVSGSTEEVKAAIYNFTGAVLVGVQNGGLATITSDSYAALKTAPQDDPFDGKHNLADITTTEDVDPFAEEGE